MGMRIVRWGVMSLGVLLATSLQAATLVVVGGELTGATGVNVGGTFYDVEFVDGTCAAVFSGCDALTDLTFQTSEAASAAAQALGDEVFLDTPQGNFDSSPDLTAGCSSSDFCGVFTPFAIVPLLALAREFANRPLFNGTDIDIVGAGLAVLVQDFTDEPTLVWARWTPTPVGVPEPSTLSLLGAAGLAALLSRRTR